MKKKIVSILLATSILCLCFGCAVPGVSTSGNGSPETNTEAAGNGNKNETPDGSEDASEEEFLVVDYQFYAEDKDSLKFDIPKTIEQNGKTYEYTGNSEYKYSEIMDVIETTVDYEVQEKDEVLDQITWISDKTGRKYLLKTDIIHFSEKQPIKMRVSKVKDWKNMVVGTEPDIPEKMDVKYYNRETEQDEICPCDIITDKTSISDPHWVKSMEPIHGHFCTDKQSLNCFVIEWLKDEEQSELLLRDEYKPYKVYVDWLYAAYPVWEGYQEDILRVLGADPNIYRITGAAWAEPPAGADVSKDFPGLWYEFKHIPGWDGWGTKNEKTGEEDCIVVAQKEAIYPFEALCRDYHAEYEGFVDTNGYKATVTYYATLEEILKALNQKSGKKYTKEDIAQDLSVIYKVTASASYKEVK